MGLVASLEHWDSGSCGVGHNCVSDLIPSLRTPHASPQGRQKKKQEEEEGEGKEEEGGGDGEGEELELNEQVKCIKKQTLKTSMLEV